MACENHADDMAALAKANGIAATKNAARATMLAALPGANTSTMVA